MSTDFFSQAGYLQFNIAFGDPSGNLAKIKALLHDLEPARKAIIALPELWAYGFDYENAADHARQTPLLLHELTNLAGDRDVIIAGSLLESVEEHGIYNTLFFIGPEGVLGKYQKQHLFSLWQEDRFFSTGECFEPVLTPHGIIGGNVCYDLRFPEIIGSQAFKGAQLVIVSAQWPLVRLDHWQALLRARAIENQLFIVACNSCGPTGDNDLGGHSMVVGPDGSVILAAGVDEEAGIVELNVQDLDDMRSKFCPAGERPRPVQDTGKSLDLPRLQEKLQAIRQQKSRVAFTNGCFDILHSGHVAYLEQARSTADCLVVGLNSDSSVRAIKGDNRPVNSEQDRARILSALACVDYVVMFEEETPHKLITAIMPDVLVKGADWEEADIVGAREVKEAGGRVERIAFEHDASTTSLISRIQKNKSQ